MRRKLLFATLALLTTAATVRAVMPEASAAPPTCASNTALNPRDLSIVGLKADGLTLTCFKRSAPSITSAIGSVTGLVTDTTLVGIDYRPFNGTLYGVGNAGGLYTIDTTTAAATSIGTISVQLSGTQFGVDFNPAAPGGGALRIVSDTGQNLRITTLDAVPTTTEDGALNDGAAVPAAVTGVLGAAYINNDNDATTGTLLFDLNGTTDRLQQQAPPNTGILTNHGGLLGVDVTNGDVDVYTRPKATANIALAVLVVGGESRLYEIFPLSGKLSKFKAVDAIDLAIPTNQ